jgi:spore coat protein U-like protein
MIRQRFLLAAGTTFLFASFNAASADVVNGSAGSSGTQDMGVSINIEDACDFSVAAPVDFGDRGIITTGLLSSASGGSNGSISVTCTTATEFSLSLEGNGSGLNMVGPAAAQIPYSLSFVDDASFVTATGSAQSIGVLGTVGTITGKPAAGEYTDTVTVTLTIAAEEI